MARTSEFVLHFVGCDMVTVSQTLSEKQIIIRFIIININQNLNEKCKKLEYKFEGVVHRQIYIASKMPITILYSYSMK